MQWSAEISEEIINLQQKADAFLLKNQTWRNLKLVLFLTKENAQTESDFFTGDGFPT